MIIVLVGYMGSGKSVVGKLLAHSLELPFIDLDEYIEGELQESISNIFNNKGEIYFRKKEHEYLNKVLQDHDHLVLATGGGTPCYSGNMEVLLKQTPYVCYLQVSVQELARRLSMEKQHRPIISHLNDDALPEYIAKHLFERTPFYIKANHTLQCDGKSIEVIVSEIKEKLV
jgi:shikimate kinase